MDTTKLLPATRDLWDALKEESALKGFVLIGGTALTMRIGHRISEDLDFSYPSAGKLPRTQIKALIRKISDKGYQVAPNDDPRVIEDAIEHGLDHHDNQQDYIINGVKVTFYAPEKQTAQLLKSSSTDPLRVATTQEIFELKCLAASERTKSRDWLDLYVLMHDHGFTVRDAYLMFEAINASSKFDSMDMRIRRDSPGDEDPGYTALMKAPPSFDGIRDFLVKELDGFHNAVGEALTKRLPSPIENGKK